MNRSLSNVLFSGFGSVKQIAGTVEGEVKPISAEDAYYILEAASNVLIVPGYGMAVAQAQHVVKELQELLGKKRCGSLLCSSSRRRTNARTYERLARRSRCFL